MEIKTTEQLITIMMHRDFLKDLLNFEPFILERFKKHSPEIYIRIKFKLDELNYFISKYQTVFKGEQNGN
jgi:hypothetical protein